MKPPREAKWVGTMRLAHYAHISITDGSPEGYLFQERLDREKPVENTQRSASNDADFGGA